jgi:hypothetical protein
MERSDAPVRGARSQEWFSVPLCALCEKHSPSASMHAERTEAEIPDAH